MLNPGHATPAGTERYRDRLSDRVISGHFRLAQGLWCSSIGLGTYLGEADARTDGLYLEAITRAVAIGCNVLDTAVNYRCQRSERTIGRALRQLVAAGVLARDEVIIATKGGFIPSDTETFVASGMMTQDDIVANCHCLAPRYLQAQLETSLRNLGLDCLDLYYLHNPETQLQEVPRQTFTRRMEAAFGVLEEAVARGQLRMYGTATWTGYRVAPNAPDYLGLEDLVRLAETVGGVDHHFKVIQLPYNMVMPEALLLRNQSVAGERLSIFEAAARLGLTVICSASLSQGRLVRRLPAGLTTALPGCETDAQRAVQFVRSAPGVTVALVGMARVAHVEDTLGLARVPPAPPAEFHQLFVPAGISSGRRRTPSWQ